jgi:hypothetical protein
MAYVIGEEIKARENNTIMGVTLGVKPVWVFHFKMQCNDYGTPKQETDLLPFVPIFRSSVHVNLCPPPPRNPKERILFLGIFGDLCYMVYQKHVEEYIILLKTIIFKYHSRVIEKGHKVRRLVEVQRFLRPSLGITRQDRIVKIDFVLKVRW